MAERDVGRLWRSRLRWKLRGAMLWPAFGVAVVVDAVILHQLPIAGDQGPGPVGALLLATFFNLIVVAVGAPLAGAWLRRRDRTLPRMIADDRAGTALLAALTLVLLAAGLAHRPSLRSAEDDFRAQSEAVRRWVARSAPAAYRRNVDRADTWKPGPDLFRTCVPGPDPRRSLCLLVLTDHTPPVVRVDPDQRPNSRVAGPDNPGRKMG